VAIASQLNLLYLSLCREQSTFTMDDSRLDQEPAPLKAPAYQVVNLDSDDDSDLNDALLMAQRVNGVNGLDALDGSESQVSVGDSEGENEEWEIDSLFEETIEELGDESLLGGGEHPETPLSMTLKITLRTRGLHS
jgi:NAD-dependent histone deacetylase SIR2